MLRVKPLTHLPLIYLNFLTFYVIFMTENSENVSCHADYELLCVVSANQPSKRVRSASDLPSKGGRTSSVSDARNNHSAPKMENINLSFDDIKFEASPGTDKDQNVATKTPGGLVNSSRPSSKQREKMGRYSSGKDENTPSPIDKMMTGVDFLTEKLETVSVAVNRQNVDLYLEEENREEEVVKILTEQEEILKKVGLY